MELPPSGTLPPRAADDHRVRSLAVAQPAGWTPEHLGRLFMQRDPSFREASLIFKRNYFDGVFCNFYVALQLRSVDAAVFPELADVDLDNQFDVHISLINSWPAAVFEGTDVDAVELAMRRKWDALRQLDYPEVDHLKSAFQRARGPKHSSKS